ncbi:hypothetical protein AMJ49_01310 [Parcubacteria bacterium DG_74_2]|nr:MAG: hypothetical protein AMJ49_01310 [Parcubacteria bacterium DG_74_2]
MGTENKKIISRFLIYLISAIVLLWPFFLRAQESITLNPPSLGCLGSEAFVNLTWTSTIGGTPTYSVLRKLKGEPDTSYIEITSTQNLFYTDKPIASDKDYIYKIKVGIVESNEGTALAPYCPPILSPPQTSCQADGPRIVLSWSSISGSLSTYEIYRDDIKIGQTANTNFTDGPNIEGTKTYNYFIRAVWQDGNSTTSETASVVASVCPPTLTATTDCLATAPGGPKVNLSWNSLLGVQYYQIYRKAQTETDFSLLKTATSTNYTDNLVESLPNYWQGGQIFYYVKAIWETTEKNSSQKQITIPRCSPYLKVETNCEEFSFRLSWTATLDATKYNIYRDEGFLYQNLGITNTSYIDGQDTGSCPGEICTHTYYVVAVDTGVNLSSNYITKDIDCATILPPSPAPVLDMPDAYCVIGDSRINLSWTASENVSYYGVYRNLVNVVNLYETYYEDRGVESGIEYTYYIIAYGEGVSTPSENAFTLTAVDCNPPSASTLTLANGCTTGQPYVNLSWSSTTNTFSYDIYRGPSADNLSKRITFDKNSPEFTTRSWNDTGVSTLTAYYYKIVSNGPSGVPSTNSDTKAITTLSCLPTTPALSLSRGCTSGNSWIKLDWITDEANTTKYEIYRKKQGEPNPTASTTILDVTKRTWTDNDPTLSPETIYDYKIEAVGYLDTQRSTQGYKSITTYNCASPGAFTLSEPTLYCQDSYPRADLSWTPSSNAWSYHLYRYRLNPDNSVAETTIFYNVASPFTDWGSGNALNFDGYYDYVTIPDSPSLNPTRITMEAWIYPTDFNYYGNIITKRDPAQYILRFYSYTGRVQGYVYSGNAWRACTTPSDIAAKLNQWNHIVHTYDGTTGRVYINGVEGCTYSYTGDIATSDATLRIGSYYTGSTASERFEGFIDEVRIYSQALNPSEVSEHYNGIYTNESELKGLWHFDEGTGQIASDSSNYGNNGTLGSTSGSDTNDPIWVTNGLQSQKKYKWQARANGPGGSTFSNITTPITLPICPPAKPGLVLTSFCEVSTGLPAVTLSWSYSINTSLYEIYRQDKGLIGTTTQRTFTDNNKGLGLNETTTYIYYIKAIGPTGLNNQSDSIPITTPDCLAPTKPENLTANFTCSGSSPRVNLSWDSSQNANYYTVYRDPSDFPFPVSTVDTFYTDTAVNTSSTYSYYIIAYGPGGSSPSSDLVSITTDYCIPSNPTINFLTTGCESLAPINTISWSDPNVEAKQIFNNGFEEGDFSKWSGIFENDGITSIESIDPHQGTYHSQFILNPINNWDGYGGSYYNPPTSYTSFYLRAYYNFDSLPNDGYGYEFNMIMPPTWDNRSAVSLIRQGDQYFWQLFFKGYTTISTPFIPQTNTWYSVELYTRVGTVAGEAKVWINGEFKASLSGIDVSGDNRINQLRAWVYTSGPPGTQRTFRIDSVIISDRYIGPGVPIYNTDRYKIYRNTTGIPPVETDLIKTITTADIEFSTRIWKDKNLNHKTPYYYWVKSAGPAGESSLSVSKPPIITYYCGIPPASTLNLDNLYCSENLPYATLSWTTSPNAYSYNLYRTNPDNSLSTYSTRISPLTDKGSFALKFDGVNDYVEVPDSPSLKISTGELTVEAWVNLNNIPSNRGIIVAKYGQSRWSLHYDGEGWGREFGFYLNNVIILQETGIPEWGQWYHVAVTFSDADNTAILYVNGVVEDTDTSVTGSLPLDGNIYIGQIYDGNYKVNGTIDEVRIYGRALNLTEVNEHYQGIYKNEAELRGVWHFDEGEGTTIFDSSGKGNNGKIAGPAWVIGKFAGALDFGGLNGYVQAPHSANLDILTFEAWFNSRDWKITNSYSATIMNKYTNNNNMFRIAFDEGQNGGIAVSAKKNGIEIGRFGTGGTTLNGWHHLVVVFTNPVKIYLDKVDITSTSGSTWNRYSADDNLYIGSRGNSGYFDGLIDEVRIYNRALATTEITEHYNGIFTDESGLVGLWHFDEVSGQIAYDDSPFWNNGTLIKGAEWIVPSDASASVYISALERGKLYKYYVKALGVGVESSASNEISFTTPSCLPIKPILNTTSTCDGTNPQIKLTWQTDPNTEYWSIYKKREGEALFKQIANTTQNLYIDGDVESGISYEYYVRAIGKGVSETSDLVSETAPFCYEPPYEGKPFSISATSVCFGYSSRIKVEWPSDSTGKTLSYNVWRKNTTLGEADFSEIASGLSPAAIRYFDVDIIEENNYIYEVEAVGSGEGNTLFSKPSDQIASLACSILPPNPPTLYLDGIESTGDLRAVYLHWTDAGNEDYYTVFRRSSDWIEIATTSGKEIPEDTYWTDKSWDRELNDGQIYDYKVIAYNVNGGTESNSIGANVPIALPGEFTLSGSEIDSTIHFTWTEASTTPAGGLVTYKVLRDNSKDFPSPTTICENITTPPFECDDATPTYLERFYKAVATNNGGSTDSNIWANEPPLPKWKEIAPY